MTKINLRKSSAIQKELFQRVHAVEIDTDIEINEYNDPKQVIETQLKEVTDNIVYKQNLLSVLYSLRAKTGIVNAKWDVNKMLAEQERIKACINLYTNLCERKPRPDLFEVKQRIENLKNEAKNLGTVEILLVPVSLIKTTSKSLNKQLKLLKRIFKILMM